MKDVITDEPLTGILLSKVSESEERIAALEAELAAIKADSSDASETFTLSEILDLRPGSVAIQVTGENVDITFELEESEDLGRNDPWTPTGHKATMTIPANTEHKFFRFAP